MVIGSHLLGTQKMSSVRIACQLRFLTLGIILIIGIFLKIYFNFLLTINHNSINNTIIRNCGINRHRIVNEAI